MLKRKRCCNCHLLTRRWHRIGNGSWHCYDGCFSTTERDWRSDDGSHWLTIPNFSDYQVSQFGEVRSLKFDKVRIIKQRLLGAKRAYRGVSLWRNGVEHCTYVHRLVIETFGDKSHDATLEVNHIDGNKSNNRFTNLEWATSSENKVHGVANGLYPTGEKCSWSKLTEQDVERIRTMHTQGMSHQAISEHFPVERRQISRVLQGTRWKQYGK